MAIILILIYITSILMKYSSGILTSQGCIITAGLLMSSKGHEMAIPQFSMGFSEAEKPDEESSEEDSKEELIQKNNVVETTTASSTTTETAKEVLEAIRAIVWKNCTEETGVGPELVEKMKKGIPYAWRKVDPLLKNWTLCVLNKKGLMSKQGVFKMDVARTKMTATGANNAEKVIDSCLSQKALPPSEIAWIYLKCQSKAMGYNSTLGIY